MALTIDQAKCTYCGACGLACPWEVAHPRVDTAQLRWEIDAVACFECGGLTRAPCFRLCPSEAIIQGPAGRVEPLDEDARE
jgi:Fe-S-cluster-containing hydrogenase component 2